MQCSDVVVIRFFSLSFYYRQNMGKISIVCATLYYSHYPVREENLTGSGAAWTDWWTEMDRLITSSCLPSKKQPGRKINFQQLLQGMSGRVLWLQYCSGPAENALCHFLHRTSDSAAAVFPRLNLVILSKILICRKYIFEKQIKEVIELHLSFLDMNIVVIPCFHATATGSYMPNLLLDLYSVFESQNTFCLFLLGASDKYIQYTLTSSAWSQDCKIFRLRYIY